MNEELVEKAITDLLIALGEDINKDGLKETPKRVSQMYKELLTYEKFNNTTFMSEYDDIVMVRDIEFTSMCEHHLLPFYGICHVCYIPNGNYWS